MNEQITGLHPSMEFDSSNGSIADIGALLRASRIRLGKSLREVSTHLRVRYVYLEAIEDGRFDELPGNTYAVGFIRSYSEYLGLDKEEVVRRFRATQADGTPKPDLVFPTTIREHGIPSGALILVGCLVAGVVYSSWYFASTKDVFVSDTASPAVVNLGHTESPKLAEDKLGRINTLIDANSASASATSIALPETDVDQSTTKSETQIPERKEYPTRITKTFQASANGEPVTRSEQISPPDKELASTSGGENAKQPNSKTDPQFENNLSRKKGLKSISAARNATTAAVFSGVPTNLQSTEVSSPPEPSSMEKNSTIILAAKGTSWIQIRNLETDTIILSKILLKGHKYEVPRHESLSLMTGNAGALEVSVNGEPVPSLGSLGQIRHRVLLDADRLKEGTAVEQ